MEAIGLSFGGWIFLIGAWGIIISVTVFCFVRLLQNHEKPEGN